MSESKGSLAGKDTLSLGEARKILQTIVSTPESSIKPGASLDQIVGFNARQRDASLIVCLDLMKRHGGIEGVDIRKKVKNGLADLFFRYEKFEVPETIGFHARIDSGPLLGVDFPLVDPKNEMDKRFVNFFNGGEVTRLDRPLDLHGYQQLFRGFKLLYANMLNWDKPNLVSLEQLDHMALGANNRKGLFGSLFK